MLLHFTNELARVTMTEMILPSHADTRGFAFAGFICGWIDIAAGIAAKRHATYPCVTRTVDDVHFLHPIKVGDLLIIQATVNRAWKTSMEVGVRVETESPLTGRRRFVAHAYLTFVALNPKPTARTMLGRALQEHRPVRVPQIVPENAIEKQRYDMAEVRRQQRFRQDKHDDWFSSMHNLMRKWSQGLNDHSTSNAEVVQHPVLMTEPELEEEEQGRKAPEVPLRHRLSVSQGTPNRPLEKAIKDSYAEVVELVLPQHANTLQITFGGKIMQWMESCSIASASRHGRTIDSLQFIKPAHVGDVVTVRSVVSRAFQSSIEVYVSVSAENLVSGEVYFTNDGFFTIVAVDYDNIPTSVPRAIPQTAEEEELYQGGVARRARRLQQRHDLVTREGHRGHLADGKELEEVDRSTQAADNHEHGPTAKGRLETRFAGENARQTEDGKDGPREVLVNIKEDR
ncbi:HotDog domain-containing protein [Jimgerdemannia flammicorona]|uniref:HotDog domain-containing protein n=2 Tax=Jimgerdemannia flammicorona TaxID=994334 RepID=A0A433DJQ1_9FUNG|nr:HotDog domain-containing protein [Jimgerdemannia flammicorona]RUS30190.1 HotDog domain-containing protein [Jimgerdemannia flammicorona]